MPILSEKSARVTSWVAAVVLTFSLATGLTACSPSFEGRESPPTLLESPAPETPAPETPEPSVPQTLTPPLPADISLTSNSFGAFGFGTPANEVLAFMTENTSVEPDRRENQCESVENAPMASYYRWGALELVFFNEEEPTAPEAERTLQEWSISTSRELPLPVVLDGGLPKAPSVEEVKNLPGIQAEEGAAFGSRWLTPSGIYYWSTDETSITEVSAGKTLFCE